MAVGPSQPLLHHPAPHIAALPINQGELPAIVILTLDLQLNGLVLQQLLQGLPCGNTPGLANLGRINADDANRRLLQLSLQPYVHRIAIGHKSDDPTGRPRQSERQRDWAGQDPSQQPTSALRRPQV